MGVVYLIRHAETTISGVLLGRLDPPLLALPAKSELAVRSIFSSPLLRAKGTASALFPNHPAVIVENLTEVSLGEWDGLGWEEIERRDPTLAARKLADWLRVTPPGGEDYGAILARAASALEAIRQSEGPLAVVAHSGINAVLWHLLTGCPITAFRQDYLEVMTHEWID